MTKDSIRLIAFDLDGTITQHKTHLEIFNKEVLDTLSKKYRLLIVGAGGCQRIYEQLNHYPVDIIGNYGMQFASFNNNTGSLEIQENNTLPIDKEAITEEIQKLRDLTGYTHFDGNTVEFHESGMFTFPLLGTKACLHDKLTFDPDRVKRRKFHSTVVDAFKSYNVFVGGSSSFDAVPKPYNKLYALDRYCQAHSLTHKNVVYVGDDYGIGGNDEDVYLSDIKFLCVDNYKNLKKCVQSIL